MDIKCSCGTTLQISDELGGRKVRCRKCGAEHRVPSTDEPRSRAKVIPSRSTAIDDPSEKTPSKPLSEQEQSVVEALRLLRHIRDLLVDCSAAIAQKGDSESLPSIATQEERPREYKVLTQKDRWFSGKFDPALLEQALNSYAEQGWVFRGVATASIPGLTGTRDEVVMILER